MVQPLWRTGWRFLKKLELPYDPASTHLGIYSEKTIPGKSKCRPASTAALFTTARTWKQSECPSTLSMRYIYMMEYYSAIKEGNNAI